MPKYPSVLPTFPAIVDNVDYPDVQHHNMPNREIEAICTEAGTNPKIISDLVRPRTLPQSVAHYLDMLAYILKAMPRVANWYAAAVPSRHHLYGHGDALTVPAGGSSYIYVFGRGLQATLAIARLPMSYPGTVVNVRCQILTGQPGTGSLDFVLYKEVAATALTFSAPAGSAAGSIVGAAGSVSFTLGQTVTVRVNNNAATASAQIGGLIMEYDQAG